jgi:hypothetical protein
MNSFIFYYFLFERVMLLSVVVFYRKIYKIYPFINNNTWKNAKFESPIYIYIRGV